MNRIKFTQRLLMVAAFWAFLAMSATAATFTVNVPSYGMTNPPHVYAWTNSIENLIGGWPGATHNNFYGGCWQFTIPAEYSPVYIIINDGGSHQTGTITITDTGQDYYFKWDEDHFNNYAYNYDEMVDPFRLDVNEIPSAVDFVPDMKFLYFLNMGNEMSPVYIYVWDENDQPLAGNWPGTPLNSIGSNSYGSFYKWSCPPNRDPKGVIFNNGNGSFQSFDLKFENGAVYFLKGKKGSVAKYISEPVALSHERFPDPDLYSQLQNYDTNGDGILNWREVSQTYTSDFYHVTGGDLIPRGQHLSFEEDISSFVGLEAFSRLTDLQITHNLAINNMSFLDWFDVIENVSVNDCFILSQVIPQYNEVLKRLRVRDCKLVDLNVTNNPLLHELRCDKNRLPSINLSGNDLLMTLNCKYNYIPELVGIEHSKLRLTELEYGFNPITTHPEWSAFSKLSCLGVASTGLTGTFPLPNMNKLPMKELDCSYNQITSCDNTNNWYNTLWALNCSHNELIELAMNYREDALERLDCSHNNIKQFTSKLNSAGLKYLDCSHNQLTVSTLNSFINGGDNQHRNLEELHCSYNLLESEWNLSDLSCSQSLRTLNCSHNQLKYINVKGMNSLKTLLAGGQLMMQIIGLSSAPNVRWLGLNETSYSGDLLSELSNSQLNQLEGLDISQSTASTYTNTLDLLARLPNLRQFFAREARLRGTMQFDRNFLLTEIDVAGNSINGINYANYAPNFYSYLNVSKNELSEMSVMPSWMLDCSHNQIRTLDFNTYNIPLMVNCSHNYITSLDMSNYNGNPNSAPYMLVNDNVNNAVYGTLLESPRHLEWFVTHYDVDDDDISVRYRMVEGAGQFHNNGFTATAYKQPNGSTLFYLDEDNEIVAENEYITLDNSLAYGFEDEQMTLLTGGTMRDTWTVGRVILIDESQSYITYRYPTGYAGELFYGTEDQLRDSIYGRDYNLVYGNRGHALRDPAWPEGIGVNDVDYTNLEFFAVWNPEVVGIEELEDQVTVVGKDYYNPLGVSSSQPFDGVNIVVTRYSNGTTRTTKVIR